MESPTAAADSSKRKRSPSISGPAPPNKSAKTSHQLSINYLARQSPEDLPLINKDDTLPNLLHLLSAYSNILDRHESLASNLGARPLGPNLIRHFERSFEAPPKVVASHHKGAASSPDESTHNITWVEVIEFARSHPSQFTLSTFSEGRRVCQFYYPQKQLRVQVSEDDFLFINSGRCQELIPPLPIWEDEEKEVGTCDVLEAKLKELTNAADTVAARTRQLSHRLKNRRAAILERRAEGGRGTPAKAGAIQTTTAPPSSMSSTAYGGFIAVNSTNGRPATDGSEPSLGSSAAVRSELLRIFESLPQNRGQPRTQSRHQSSAGMTELTTQSTKHPTAANHSSHAEGAASNTSSLSPVPASLFTNEVSYGTPEQASSRPHASSLSHGHRPSSSTGNYGYSSGHAPVKHNFSRPLAPDLESSQPFRPLCQAHMDGLPRGERVVPPCDRCRRLKMDCVKNLTSCAGCTRKHARCHWRDVSRDELGELDQLMDSTHSASGGHGYSPTHGDAGQANGYINGYGDHDRDDSEDDDSNPLEDLEALGEKEEEENRLQSDEDDVQSARGLTKQGWEDSLRSAAQHNPFAEAGQVVDGKDSPADHGPNGVTNDPAPPADDPSPTQPPEGNMKGHEDADTESAATAEHRHNYDPVRSDSEKELNRDRDQVPSHATLPGSPSGPGGFKAVNE